MSEPCGDTVLDSEDGAGESQRPMNGEPLVIDESHDLLDGSGNPVLLHGSHPQHEHVQQEYDYQGAPPLPESHQVNMPCLPLQTKRARHTYQQDAGASASGCKDRIKWVGEIPFVQSHSSGAIYSGRCKMYRIHHIASTTIECDQRCCIFSGLAHGGLCDCLCHVLAADYSSRQ